MNPRVTKEIIEEIGDFYKEVLCPPEIAGKDVDIEKLAREVLYEERIEEQLSLFFQYSPLGKDNLKGKMILEIGSGFGVFLALCRNKYGLGAFGIEPDEKYLALATKVLHCYEIRKPIIIKGYGEALPFRDESFDMIYSTNVLEHAREWKKVISEALRVLKKGGYLQFVIPNFGSFWEGHYGLLWIPNIPKSWAEFYVKRLFARSPAYINKLQFINQSLLEKVMSKHEEVKVLNWGFELWEERLRSGQFSEWGFLNRLKIIINIFRKLKMIAPIIALGKRLKWHTPIVMSVIKKVTE